MIAQAGVTQPVRTVRPRGEVPRLLLAAARELFSAKGFDATTTEDIASRAGVSKALLFRHFGGKAGLFERAVTEPFAAFITDYVTTWEQIGAAGRPPGTLATELIRDLAELFRENRELLLAVLAASSFETAGPQSGQRSRTVIEQLVDRLTDLGQAEATVRGSAEVDFPVLVRGIVGLAAGLALLEPWLLAPGADVPDQERIVGELSRLLIRAVSEPNALEQ